MNSTMSVNIPIPHLKKDQSIEDWRRSFVASVALIEEKQALRLLPTYVCRTPGDQLLAEVAAKEETLEKALDQLQTLIDGEISDFIWMERFCGAKLDDPSTAGQTALFFELMKIANNAGLSPQKAVLRFLNIIPSGKVIYRKIRDDIVENLDDDQLPKLFKKIQPLLKEKDTASATSHWESVEGTDSFKTETSTDTLTELHKNLDYLHERLDKELEYDSQPEIA